MRGNFCERNRAGGRFIESHRDNRLAMVVSGDWHFGYGSKADDVQTSVLTQGAFYTEPANTPHFAFTGDQPATVFITGTGPSDTRFEEDGSPFLHH